MAKSHNKKRNVGIIYELLLRNISDSLIDGDKSLAEKALKIIEKRFDKSTEVYKEFRLFNALAKSTVSDSAVAAAILTEAKQAARRCNSTTLKKEKSLLIRDINYSLKDKDFYHRRLPEYTVYATIQTLLNDWRDGDRADLTRTIQYESRVAEWLLSEKVTYDIDKMSDPSANALVVKIMSEKINKKYSYLDRNQRDILQEYVFSLSENNDDNIRHKLLKIKDETIIKLSSFEKKTDNSVLLNKINNVKEKIENEKLNEINDESISRFLVLLKLKSELGEALNG